MSHQENLQAFQSMLDNGFHCSQCVFVHWAHQMGLEEEFAAKISSGLGMGVNHGDSCGAVTSTALVLGLAHGFSSGDQSNAEGGVEATVKEFNAAFAARNGSLLCRDLLSGGYDAADPDAKVPEGVDPWENCAKYCADAVELAERYLTSDALANRPKAEKTPEQPSPIIVGAGSGAAGLALGAGAMAVIAYERRRAENEKR